MALVRNIVIYILRIIFHGIDFLECFETGKNSFEQMCINYLNEKMQQLGTNELIKHELDWYQKEGLDSPQIGFLDNSPILGSILFVNYN